MASSMTQTAVIGRSVPGTLVGSTRAGEAVGVVGKSVGAVAESMGVVGEAAGIDGEVVGEVGEAVVVAGEWAGVVGGAVGAASKMGRVCRIRSISPGLGVAARA